MRRTTVAKPNREMFFEDDHIRVKAVTDETVIIRVKRRKHRAFTTTITKKDFSIFDQNRFTAICANTVLRRNNGYFSLV